MCRRSWRCSQDGTPANDTMVGVVACSSDEVVVAGRTNGDWDGTNSGGTDVAVTKLAVGNGTEVWRYQVTHSTSRSQLCGFVRKSKTFTDMRRLRNTEGVRRRRGTYLSSRNVGGTWYWVEIKSYVVELWTPLKDLCSFPPFSASCFCFLRNEK